MKKVILLIMSVFLLVAFALPAIASDVTWGGRIYYGGMTAFAPKEGKAASAYWKYWSFLTAEVDDYNTIYMEFDFAATKGATNWDLGGAYIDSDFGAALGFPVGLVMRGGNFWGCTRKYESSWHATERVGRQCAHVNGVQGTIDFGMGNVAVGSSIGENFGATVGETAPAQWAILTLPEIGPASVEAFLFGVGQTEFKPVIGVNAKASIEPVNVSAGFDFDMAAEGWAFGLGARAGFGMFAVGAALNGNDTDILNVITLEAGAEFMEGMGADVGTKLSLASGADLFQGVDISVYYNPGAASWRVGYIVTTKGYSYLSPAALTDGGLYVSADLTF